jgi:predicted dehydrogenase
MLPALGLQPDVAVVAVAARGLDSARQAAVRIGAAEYTDEWRDVIDLAKVDAVVATAEPSVHANVLRACITAGIPVFVDKPPAPSLASMRELAALEAAHRGVAFVGFNFAFSAAYRRFLVVASHEDVPVHMKLHFVSSKPRTDLRRYGSITEAILLEGGTHAVDLVVRALGPARAQTASRVRFGTGLEGIHLRVDHHPGGQSWIELGNYAQSLELAVEVVCHGGRRGILDQLGRQRVWASAAETATCEVTEWSPRAGGFDRAGYAPALGEFLAAARQRRTTTSPLSHGALVYEVLDDALQQLDGRPLGRGRECP